MAENTATGLLSLNGLEVLPRSAVTVAGTEVGFARTGAGARLAILASPEDPAMSGFEGERNKRGDRTLLLGVTNAVNLAALQKLLPWLRPRVLGSGSSFGFGDRLGIATTGHVRALRGVGDDVAPVFAQQSIREMERTGRTPREVMDDAAWGAFAERWREGFGADADHLKTTADVDACVAAGYTFFTFDPGEHVDDRAETVGETTLKSAFDSLSWEILEDRPEDLRRRYLDGRLTAEDHEITFDENTLARAAVKYGGAVAHASRLYRHLVDVMGGKDFEVEVSVDETESPTTYAQHVYIARELERLGVRWVSLAPRYVGGFEKGVDYIGSVSEFEADIAVHAAIARTVSREGPYKLSLHSGSDKLSIYPAFARQTGGLFHVKTAGTSYLEALRAVATLDPGFFREIYVFARGRYEEDRASYHVSAELERAPLPADLDDAGLSSLLEQFDAREILHVTFGSVLKEPLRDRLLALLRQHPDKYAAILEEHFSRHLKLLVWRGTL